MPPWAAEAGMPARVVAKKHSCGCVARYESRRRRPNLALFYGPRAMGAAVSPLDKGLRRDHADISGERLRWFIVQVEMAKRAKQQL